MATIIYMSKMNEKDSANMQTCVKIKRKIKHKHKYKIHIA